jgi:hypothetical protein
MTAALSCAQSGDALRRHSRKNGDVIPAQAGIQATARSQMGSAQP